MPSAVVAPPRWEGLEELFRAEHAPLVRLAHLIVGDAGVAEEIVQEAFVRFHRASGRGPAPGAEGAYLRGIVVNLCRGHHRRLAIARRIRPLQPSTPATADSGAIASERRARLVAAVRTLPHQQRACVVLHYFEDRTDVEVAAVLGISAGSVKTHLHRARAALAHALEDLR
jgi:RNA polymerase sigma-70 factor (sigma-E family)